jgi:hypothetical protein
VIRAAVASGVHDPDLLEAILADVLAAGSPRRHQLALFS